MHGQVKCLAREFGAAFFAANQNNTYLTSFSIRGFLGNFPGGLFLFLNQSKAKGG